MPKITVVQEGVTLSALCDLSPEELIIYVEKWEDLDPSINFRTLVDVCQSRPFVLRRDAMPEIIVMWIIRNSKLIPIIEVTSIGSTVPWRPFVPKRTPEGSIRILPDNCFMGYDAGKKEYFMVPAGAPVDIRGFRIPGRSFSISDISGIFDRIQAERTFMKSRPFLEMNYIAPVLDPRYIQPETGTISTPSFILKLLSYISLLPSSSPAYLVIPFREVVSFILGKGPGEAMKVAARRKDMDKEYMGIESSRWREKLAFSFLRSLMARNGIKVSGNSSSSLLQALGEKKGMEAKAELDAYLSYISMVRTCACDHLKYLTRFQDTVKLSGKKSHLRKLMEYAGNPKERKEMITCRLCSLPLICPHVLISFALGTPQKVREALDVFSDGTQNEERGACCRICGDDLFLYDFDESFEEYYADVYAPINRYMWSSSMTIYGTLRMRPPLDSKSFTLISVKTAIGALVASELGPVKNALEVFNRTGDITFEIQFYCLLFLYSFILCVIRHYLLAEDKSNLVSISFAETPGKQKDIASLAGIILKRFEGMHAYIYSSVKKENIVAEFKAIYGEMIKYAPNAKFVSYIDPGVSVIASIMSCSTFKYIESMLGASGESFHDIRELFSRIFGSELEEVIGRAMDGLPIFLGMKPLEVPKNASKSYMDRVSIFNLFLDSIKKASGEKGKEKGDGADRYAGYPAAKLGRGINRAIMYIYGPFIGKSRPIFPFEIQGIYDENGRDHVWTRERGDKSSPLGPIIDLKCSVCNILRSQVSKLDATKCRKGREREEAVLLLYKLFTRYCPEGGHHTLAKGTCSKCGFVSGSRSDAFISAYMSRAMTVQREGYKLKQVKKEQKISPKGESPDPSKLLEVARLGGVTNAFVESIGLMLGLEYDEVLSGKSHHPLPSSRYSITIYTLIGYIRSVFYFFNVLKNASSAPHDLAFDVHKVLKEASYPPSAWTRLSRLPDFYEHHIHILAGIQDDAGRSGEELYSFLIHMLCTVLLEPMTGCSSEFKGVCSAFSKAMTEHIIASERYTCKAGPYDKSLFARRKDELFIPAPFDANPDILLEEKEKSKGDTIDYTGYNDADGD